MHSSDNRDRHEHGVGRMSKTVAELKVELRELGLPVSGRKTDLVHRLHMHNNPITHGQPSGRINNPVTHAHAQLMQQRRDEWRELRGVPTDVAIGVLYQERGLLGQPMTDKDGQPIMVRLYAEDALPPHDFRTREEMQALTSQDAMDMDGEEE